VTFSISISWSGFGGPAGSSSSSYFPVQQPQGQQLQGQLQGQQQIPSTTAAALGFPNSVIIPSRVIEQLIIGETADSPVFVSEA